MPRLLLALRIQVPLTVLLCAGAPGIRAQTTPAEIQFVFGSDTSTSGFDLSHPTTRYNAGGFDLYASPTGNAARVMDDAFRARNTDFFGTPLRLTWWMQAGSLYGTAENTNVPLGSTLSPYRMRTFRGDAIARHGDEFTFHYHTWVWSDYDGDGKYWWNQALSFDESREDFDRTMAQMLIEEDTFPVSFRSGWHYMDDAWQAHIDRLIPFSLHNDWPHVRNDTEEPTDNIFDWSRAPSSFIPFHPSTSDYQVPGDGASWNVRSIHFGRATDALIRGIFETARSGTDQVVCIWSHLAEASFVDDLQVVLDRIAAIAPEYPDVPFRYATAVEAMQRYLATEDRTPPTLTVEPVAGGSALRITADEPIFQRVPFVAVKDRYERYAVLPVQATGTGSWQTDFFDPAVVAVIRIAVTDTVGNFAEETVRYLPDDVYLDNAGPAFSTPSGSWTAVGFPGHAHVWGTDIAVSTLAAGAESVARWDLPVTEAARYNVFVRMPAVARAADEVDMELYAGGVPVASRRFDEAPQPDAWHFVGSVDLAPADAPYVRVRASGDGQAGRVLGVDAVRLTALVRERQLELPYPEIEFEDVVAGEPATVSLALRNLGIGRLTVTGFSDASGSLAPAGSLPIVIDGPVEVTVPMRLHSETIRAVEDSLLIRSDDPVSPVVRLPYRVTFRDWFTIADNDDAGSYMESGAWNTSVTQAYGQSSRYAFVPSAAEPHATFALTAKRAGAYEASFIVPKTENAAQKADYLVEVDAVRMDSVRIDQNAGSGFWRSLGLYELGAGADVRITIRATDPDQPTAVLRADAFRLSRLGDRLEEHVLDDADAEHYAEEGTWHTSNSQAFGGSSRYAPWGSDAKAVFHAIASRSGTHVLYEIVPRTENAALQARYEVYRNDAFVGSVVIDQNAGSGAWRPLGAWLFTAGDRIAVEVTDEATESSGHVLRADAIRLVYGGSTATGVAQEAPGDGWALDPNYPNPFRGTTTLSFTLRDPSDVTLRIFDLLGREVRVLQPGELPAGRHETVLDAKGLSAGTYLYRIEAGHFAASRSMIVLR